VVSAFPAIVGPVLLITALAALAVAIAYLMLARAPREAREAAPPGFPRHEIPLRMAAAALLVTLLSAAADRLRPLAGGVLAALPVLASVLAIFTHRREGPGEAAALLRGMLAGMSGFVAFCEVVAVLIVPVGVGPALAAATVVALAVPALAVARPPRVLDQRAAAGARS
jgi:hypothetical protein